MKAGVTSKYVEEEGKLSLALPSKNHDAHAPDIYSRMLRGNYNLIKRLNRSFGFDMGTYTEIPVYFIPSS